LVIIGDIGGTNARLSLLDPTGKTVHHEVLQSRQHPSLEAVLRVFLDHAKLRAGRGGKDAGKRGGRTASGQNKVHAAAFGIAGPVVNGRAVGTNLPWVVDARSISRKLAIPRVALLNDLMALALGTLSVKRSKVHVLGDAGLPKKKGANIAVLAAGTGLGEAMLVWDGARFVPSATEGGHTDFAPRDEIELELFQFLRGRFGHVSYERILSGDGLGNLYDFFRHAKGVSENAENAETIAAAPDRNAAIANLGETGKSDAAARAVELFAMIYGAEAGNLALKTLSLAGVYVCGNIAAHMTAIFDRGGFRRAFADKGRFMPVMEKIPVAVVLDNDIGLAGAAHVALDRSA
jgi:glucokinase